MGTLLKAYLKNTDDPVEMFFDYTDSILKADTNSFLQAIIDDKSLTNIKDWNTKLKKDIEELKSMMSSAKVKQYKTLKEKYDKDRKKISGLPKRNLSTKEKADIKNKLKALEKKFNEDVTSKNLNFASLGIGETEPFKGVDDSWLSSTRIYVDEQGRTATGSQGKRAGKENEYKVSAKEKTTGWEAYPARNEGKPLGVTGNNRQVNVRNFIKILNDIKKEIKDKGDTGLINNLIKAFEAIQEHITGMTKDGEKTTEDLEETQRKVSAHESEAELTGEGVGEKIGNARKAISSKNYKALVALKTELDNFKGITDGEGFTYLQKNIENPLRKLGLDKPKAGNKILRQLRQLKDDAGIHANLSNKKNREKYKKEIDTYLKGQWYAKLADDFNEILGVGQQAQMQELTNTIPAIKEMIDMGFDMSFPAKTFMRDMSDRKMLRSFQKKYDDYDNLTTEEKKNFAKDLESTYSSEHPDGKKVTVSGKIKYSRFGREVGREDSEIEKVPLFLAYVKHREKDYKKWLEVEPTIHLTGMDRDNKEFGYKKRGEGSAQSPIFVIDKNDLGIVQLSVDIYNLLNEPLKEGFPTLDGKRANDFLEVIEYVVSELRTTKKLFNMKEADTASKFFKNFMQSVSEAGNAKTYSFKFTIEKDKLPEKEMRASLGEGRVEIKQLKVLTTERTLMPKIEFKLEFDTILNKKSVDELIAGFKKKFELKSAFRGKSMSVPLLGALERGVILEIVTGAHTGEPVKMTDPNFEKLFKDRMEFYREKRKETEKIIEENLQLKLWNSLDREGQKAALEVYPKKFKGFKLKDLTGEPETRASKKLALDLMARARKGDKTAWLKNGKRMWDTWRENGTVNFAGVKEIRIDTDKIKVEESKDKPIVTYKTVKGTGKPNYKMIKVNGEDFEQMWELVKQPKTKETSDYKEAKKEWEKDYPQEIIEAEYELLHLMSELKELQKEKRKQPVSAFYEEELESGEKRTTPLRDDPEGRPKVRNILLGRKNVGKFSKEFSKTFNKILDPPKDFDITREEWKKIVDNAFTERERKTLLTTGDKKVTPAEWQNMVQKEIDKRKPLIDKMFKDWESKKPKIKPIKAVKPHYQRKKGAKITGDKQISEGVGGVMSRTRAKRKEVKKMSKTTNQRVTWREILKVN